MSNNDFNIEVGFGVVCNKILEYSLRERYAGSGPSIEDYNFDWGIVININEKRDKVLIWNQREKDVLVRSRDELQILNDEFNEKMRKKREKSKQ